MNSEVVDNISESLPSPDMGFSGLLIQLAWVGLHHIGKREGKVVCQPFLRIRLLDVYQRMVELGRRGPRHGYRGSA